MRRKKSISLLLGLSLALSLTGCGNAGTQQGTAKQSAGANITLLEPVNASASFEEAAYRNLYDAKVYPATVVPYIEEYSSEDGIEFYKYGAYPGETVKKGDSLIYSNTEAMDKKIEDMEESIQNMEEAYRESNEDDLQRLKDSEAEWGNLKYCVEAYEDIEPEEFVDGATVSGGQAGTKVKNPEYVAWKAEYDKYIGRYRILDHSRNTIKQGMEHRAQLYELDYAYQQKLLENMKAEKKEVSITSEMAGTVVAMNLFTPGNYINKDVTVVAVGDMQQKLLKCEYINKSTAEKAEDIYALIDGKRYELEYQAMDTDEYVRLTSQGETVQSTFTLLNAGEEVNIGDFAVVAVVADFREYVLSVPKEAIHKDSTGSYVYVVSDKGNIYTTIKTGMSDGVYTEVLSGLNAGDKILLENAKKPGTNTAKVTRGNFHNTYEERGMMSYPSSSILKNPIENGTVYFVSSDIQTYQHVEKGDVIATVRVVSDDIALARNETKRTRLLERISDLEKADAEANKKEIENKREQLAEVEQDIAEQKADFAATQILADRSGIVIWRQEFEEEDILQKKCNLVEIADEDKCYVSVGNPNQLLQYGNKVTIAYVNAENQNCTAEGMVATMSQVGVSASLQAEYSMILLPKDQIGEMSQTADEEEGWWSRYRYDVSATIREMNDVLVVPKKAVKEINGRTYVNVVEDSGKIVAKGFIAGGYNTENYWVVDGLTEGMEICLE